MNALNRLKRIISANINHMLEKAEDPEVMIKQLIREMDQEIINLRTEVARAIATEKKIGRHKERLQAERDKWHENSVWAVKHDNDERARTALGKKLAVEQELSQVEQQHDAARSLSDSMKMQLQTLEDKIQEARRKKDLLLARKRRAQAQQFLMNTAGRFEQAGAALASDLNDPVLSADNRLSSLEDTITEMETMNAARQEVLENTRSPDAEFDRARRQEAVEDALNTLKMTVRNSDD